MKTISKAVAVASLISAGFVGQAQAEVEVSASAAVANMYLWRGQDLGAPGVPAISGDLSASMGGAYAGVWTSSGDTAAGQEYDLYVGYGLEVGSVGLDLSYATYIYPGDANDDATDSHELILGVSAAGVDLGVYYNLDDDSDYVYYTLGYGIGKFSATLGTTTGNEATEEDANGNAIDFDGNGVVGEAADANYTHLDITYAYNDNLSFTVSQIVAQDLDTDPAKAESVAALDDSTLVAVTYSLPIQ